MPNRTIYVPDNEQAFFDAAKRVSGMSLSQVIMYAIRQYVLDKQLLSNVTTYTYITVTRHGKRTKYMCISEAEDLPEPSAQPPQLPGQTSLVKRFWQK